MVLLNSPSGTEYHSCNEINFPEISLGSTLWEASMIFIMKPWCTSTKHSCWKNKGFLNQRSYFSTKVQQAWHQFDLVNQLPSFRMPIHRTVHWGGWVFSFSYAIKKRSLLLPWNFKIKSLKLFSLFVSEIDCQSRIYVKPFVSLRAF